MSRVGKKPIPMPEKVAINIDGQDVTVKGPKGELSLTMLANMSAGVEDGNLVVSRATDSRTDRAVHGLTRALLNNMVTGVSAGFTRTLIVEGVGYSGEVRGTDLVMRLGFSHEVVITPPEHISFEVEGRNPTTVRVKGIDKQVVGQVAADIRKLRPPEPYLGKGVRYSDEVIRRKVGKTGK